MDRLYLSKALILKAAYAAVLPLLTELVAMLFDPANAALFLFFVVFVLALAYTVPLLLSLRAILKEKADSLGKYMLLDGAFLLFPAIVSTVITETVFIIFDKPAYLQGFFSLLVICTVTLISLVFWLLYTLLNKRHR